MNKLTIETMARKDAERWAFAQLFYGEGAGTMRKLLEAEFDSKSEILGWQDALDKAHAKLDLGKIAEQAVKHREKLDRGEKLGKNLRALKSGRLDRLSTGVYVAAGVAYLGYVAHVTGYDKLIVAKAKNIGNRVWAEYTVRRDGARIRQLRDDVYGG